MLEYKYLIVGGGMTADAAVRGIRDVDKEGSIGLISAETVAPYNRPPLSKGLWKGKPVDKIWRKTDSLGAELHLGRRAVALDPQTKRVIDSQATVYAYDRLLLATGGAPRRLPFEDSRILYFRTLADYQQLRAMADTADRLAVVGAGFIGSEIAASLAGVGKKVVMVFPERAIGLRAYPPGLADFVTQYFHEQGVEVLPGQTVAGFERRTGLYRLGIRSVETKQELDVLVDGVVAGLGIVPEVGLAQDAGLTVENGIVVDETLQTSHPDIYAAGDVAAFYSPALGQRRRVEHEDNANTMGRMAGQSMAGQAVKYDHLPFFYSDLFDLGYEAVGELDTRLEMVEDWQDQYRKGVVYYLREGHVRGVLLWNTWGQVQEARNLIEEGASFKSSDLKGRITD